MSEGTAFLTAILGLLAAIIGLITAFVGRKKTQIIEHRFQVDAQTPPTATTPVIGTTSTAQIGTESPAAIQASAKDSEKPRWRIGIVAVCLLFGTSFASAILVRVMDMLSGQTAPLLWTIFILFLFGAGSVFFNMRRYSEGYTSWYGDLGASTGCWCFLFVLSILVLNIAFGAVNAPKSQEPTQTSKTIPKLSDPELASVVWQGGREVTFPIRGDGDWICEGNFVSNVAAKLGVYQSFRRADKLVYESAVDFPPTGPRVCFKKMDGEISEERCVPRSPNMKTIATRLEPKPAIPSIPPNALLNNKTRFSKEPGDWRCLYPKQWDAEGRSFTDNTGKVWSIHSGKALSQAERKSELFVRFWVDSEYHVQCCEYHWLSGSATVYFTR